MTNKKNLSILIYSLAGGGAERVVSLLLNKLKDKFNIILVLMNDTISYDISNNLKIIYLENSNPTEYGIKKLFKLPFLGLKYKKICKENNVDISLSFMNRSNYINNISKILGNTSKVIISERTMPSLQHKNGIQGFMNRYLIKLLYPKSDRVIANSLGNNLDLTNNFCIDNVITINNPVEVIINPIADKANKNKQFTFVTIGRLDSGKNHQLMIAAMQNIDAKLLIIGDGILRESLSIQIKKLKLNKKVFLLGKKENVFRYLMEAECFIFTSNFEGFPNVLLEALSAKLPIISTDCQSGPREILAPSTDIRFQIKNDIEIAKFGILTPLNDTINLKKAMELMINNDKLRENYKKRANIRAEYFNKDKIIKEWIKIIKCVE